MLTPAFRHSSLGAALLTVTPLLASCAATRVAIRYHELVVQSEVDGSIFLEPGSAPGSVYLEVQSTSGVDAPIRESVARAFEGTGYTVVDDASGASYILQLNLRQVTRQRLNENETVETAMLRAAGAGVTAGLVAGVLGEEEKADEVMVVGGLAAYAADALVDPVAWTLLTDVRFTEMPAAEDVSPRRPSQVIRIVSGASKVNLRSEEAVRALSTEVARVVAGILPRKTSGT